MKVTADLDLCQGHQQCQAEAPTVFGFNADEDVVELLKEDVTEEELTGVRQAVKYCPAFALELIEE